MLAGLTFNAAVSAETLRLGGTGAALGSMALLAKAYQRLDPGFELQIVPNLGSSGAIKALLEGSIQVAATSRPLKPDEAASGLQAFAYGRTAFVLATTKDGVDGLTMAQIVDLYSGRQPRWGDGKPVRLVLRPPSDGDTALLAAFSPEVKAVLDIAMAREGMVTAMTDQDSATAIERLPGGLGTSTLALLISEQRRARALAIDGVAPTVDNVADGSYRFTKTMYLVVGARRSMAASKFLAFVDSDAGRRILAKAGHTAGSTAKPAAAGPALR
jgi:phosphate transport system substrate-binding protein